MPLMLDVFAAIIEHLLRLSQPVLQDHSRNLSPHPRQGGPLRLISGRCRALSSRRAQRGADATRDRSAGAPARGAGSKATKLGVAVAPSEAWATYWALLSEHLERRFGGVPVHSLAEIDRLRRRFPGNIRLHVASLANEILADTVVFEGARVAHVQYIASGERGRDMGALDKLFLYLLEETFSTKAFFDFGISNEQA
jgi:hypothetical protein